MQQICIFFVVCVSLLLTPINGVPIHETDLGFMNDFFNSVTNVNATAKFAAWIKEDTANACNWPYISCDSNGHITFFDFNNELFYAPKFTSEGFIPESVGNLTELRTFHIRSTRIGGTVPEALFKLPNILEIWLRDSEFTGPVPAMPSHLLDLHLGGNLFSGKLPAFAPDAEIEDIYLPRNNFDCPTIQEIEAYQALPYLDNCQLEMNPWGSGSDAGMCNWTLTDWAKIKRCVVTPGIVGKYTAHITRKPEATFKSDKLYLETYDRKIYFYAVNNVTLEPFRDEPIVWEFWSFKINDKIPVDGKPNQYHYKQAHDIPFLKFDSFYKIENDPYKTNSYILNGTLTNGADAAMLIDFSAEGGMKFSIYISNFEFDDVNTQTMDLSITITSLAPHSRQEPFICRLFGGENNNEFDFGHLCDSDVVDYNIGIDGFDIFFNMTTENEFMDFNVPTWFEADGISSVFGPTTISYVRATPLVPVSQFTQQPKEDQQIVFMLKLATETSFANTFYYDPTISLSLLFDTSQPPVPQSIPEGVPSFVPKDQPISPEDNSIQNPNDNTGAIAAGVSIAVAIIIVGTVAGIYYYKKKHSFRKSTAHMKDKLKNAMANEQQQSRKTEETQAPPKTEEQVVKEQQPKLEKQNSQWRKSLTPGSIDITNQKS